MIHAVQGSADVLKPWEQLPLEQATYEFAANIKRSFVLFLHEDKVAFQRGVTEGFGWELGLSLLVPCQTDPGWQAGK